MIQCWNPMRGTDSRGRRPGRWPTLGRSWFHAAVVLVLFALPAAGQDAATQIQAQIDRLQQSLNAGAVTPPGFSDISKYASDQLHAAAVALRAGQVYLSLEDLQRASDAIQGGRTYREKIDAMSGGLPAFESEWGKISVQVTALDQKTAEKNWDATPAALRALYDTAQSMASPLLEGARAAAVSTQPRDGLFNVGQAEGEAEFAAFCATLHLPRKATAYPLRSLLPEIQTLQEKTNAAFQPPRSIDLNATFMQLNSTLKQARELDAKKSYAGALYQYLYAVGYYGMLDAAPLDASQQSALKSSLAAERQKLDASKRDDSIAELFLERAESQVTPVGSSAPGADDWRIAKVIIDKVLPAYFALDKPLAMHERASGKTVEITLVRWPYT